MMISKQKHSEIGHDWVPASVCMPEQFEDTGLHVVAIMEDGEDWVGIITYEGDEDEGTDFMVLGVGLTEDYDFSIPMKDCLVWRYVIIVDENSNDCSTFAV